ncbi:helix-turn-helix domain-containing protein [Saccharomonospora xinjiangensis]|uniref:helix-turn-helix domain-containing protein n=1 Tax=Saccharomonospora xinjiangensis TaxID=75294 RepID=UPI001FFC86FC|nr:helix-turn-helix transcriptional regulator [Saccharomonospora xinjiangensis]
MAETGLFARELRRWRATRRLSQLDLAIRAETTQRYVSYLEQGRSQPGRTVVLRLAESLGLSLRERNALLLAAGYAPAFEESGLDSPRLAPIRTALRRVLDGHLPYPALIVNTHGVLVEANAAFALFTEDTSAELLREPVNVFRLALHPDGLARRVLNLPEWGRHVTEALHARARLSPDPELHALVTELESYLPGAEPGPDHLGFAVPLHLRTGDGDLSLITTVMAIATPTDVALSELRLEAFLPVDAATADLLRARAERATR